MSAPSSAEHADGPHFLGLRVNEGGGASLIRRFGTWEEAHGWAERENRIAERWGLPWRARWRETSPAAFPTARREVRA